MNTETYNCQACAAEVVRPAARGTRPKWCADCRGSGVPLTNTCPQCGGKARRDATYCSKQCRLDAGAWPIRQPKPRPTKPPRDPRGPFRRSYEDREWAELLNLIRQDCDLVGGCWLWQRTVKRGYPTVDIGGRMHYVHRLALAAKHGRELGKQAAHHTCASTQCVNPDHLQPVTHAENAAEMLARTYMVQRIEALERALREHSPWHPLLNEVGLPAA